MKNNLSLTWDLETIFEGGSESSELKQYIQAAQDWIETFKQQVTPFAEKPELDQLVELAETIRQVSMHNGEISAFVSCLTAQDVNDKYARRLVGIRNELNAATQKLITKFSFALSRIDDQEWQSWLEDQQLIEIRFVLSELRDEAKDKLPEDQEQLITDLEIDGYHAWGEMYDTIVGSMTVAWENEQLSIGQLENKLNHANREVRELAFQKLEQAWLDKADLFTETLNHLAGFRLQTYAHRNWDDILKEPLNYNRMTNKTLSTMWETIVKNKQVFYEYLNRKAEKFGLDQLAWYDLEAPISQDVKEINYQEAADIIIKQFGQYSERMAEYATLAFEESWIEAEDRPGKRPGGFCTSFPESKQSRIFMTYSNTASNMATLAHELGHGYHQYVMDEIDLLNQNYAMNVAETASTLAEMIVADAMVEEATTKEERLVLIEDKIQRSVAFFMNIHARFLFETRFYQARKEGVVSTEQLNELMEQAQREAYGDRLSTYHPIFWASKLHFHITDVPFYNFPYTFGYLFSLGIYAYAKSDKKNFANFYDALLKDTGRMKVEELAKIHLNVDLEQPEFWQRAIDLCIEDVKQFIELTN